MKLSEFDGKYVRIKDTYGNSISGRARYGNSAFLACEWGFGEDGIFIGDVLILNSQISSIEEIIPHGTAELWTEHLILRKYRPEDAGQLYESLGKDPNMSRYSGWNPYATEEMAEESVRQFIDSYQDEHLYSWVMDVNGDDVIAGTIGAYDYENGQIEVGFSVAEAWQKRGFATEALTAVLKYLSENEGILCVMAWCAAENTASRRVLEKAGMQLVNTEKEGLVVDEKTYDKLIYEYKCSRD